MNTDILAETSLFSSIRPDEIGDLLKAVPYTELYFKKGEILFMQDEPCNRMVILLSGSVKAEMSDASGRIFKVEDIYAPDPLAILFLFGDHNRFPVQATAREEIKALVIPKQSVLKLLRLHETLLKNYLDISANFATRLSRKLHLMSFRTIRQKVAMYLLEQIKQQQSETVTLGLTKSALAEYFGVSRPSLERELTRMQEEGLLQFDRKQVRVPDKSRLMRLIEF